MADEDIEKFLTDLGCLKNDLELVSSELEKDIINTNIECQHHKVSKALTQIGNLLFNRKEFKQALDFFLRALLANKIFNLEENKELADLHKNVAEAYLALDNFNQALSHFNKAHIINKNIFVNFDPKLEDSYRDLSRVYIKSHNFVNALETYNEAHNQCEKLFQNGEKDYDLRKLAFSHKFYGKIYMKYGDYLNALNQFETGLNLLIEAQKKANEDFKETNFDDDINMMKILIGHVFLEMRDFSKCYDFYNEVNQFYLKKTNGKDDLKRCRSLSCLADYYLKIGKLFIIFLLFKKYLK
jgi:tetratricopeptide (TPR) repeat protein